MNMGRTTNFFAAALLAGGMFGWASAAQANPISIGLDTGSGIVQVAYGCQAPAGGTCNSGATAGTASIANYTQGNFTVTASANGTGAYGSFAEPGFGSNTIDVSSLGAGTITIYVTEQYVSFGAGGVYLSQSGFTSNAPTTTTGLMPTMTLSTYIDNSNADFGTAYQLASKTFDGTQGQVSINANTPDPLSNDYAITQEYVLTATAANQSANLSISYVYVPEPSALSIFGTALLALGGIFWFRRRKMQA